MQNTYRDGSVLTHKTQDSQSLRFQPVKWLLKPQDAQRLRSLQHMEALLQKSSPEAQWCTHWHANRKAPSTPVGISSGILIQSDRVKRCVYIPGPSKGCPMDYPALPIGFQTGHPDRRVLVHVPILGLPPVKVQNRLAPTDAFTGPGVVHVSWCPPVLSLPSPPPAPGGG